MVFFMLMDEICQRDYEIQAVECAIHDDLKEEFVGGLRHDATDPDIMIVSV